MQQTTSILRNTHNIEIFSVHYSQLNSNQAIIARNRKCFLELCLLCIQPPLSIQTVIIRAHSRLDE